MMFMFLKRRELPPKADPGKIEADVERRWQQHSYNCWRDHFSRFLCEIPSAECSEAEVKKQIANAALAADEALLQEQERWGRTALREKEYQF